MKNLNKTAKLAFYNSRRRKGDAKTVAGITHTPIHGICKQIVGLTPVSNSVANKLFTLSRRRIKTSELVNA